MSQYELVARAIDIITQDPKQLFSLEELSKELNIDPTKLQKTFTQWAGISPKQFQRYLSLEYAKGQLKSNQNNLQTSIITGLSSTGRLHDLFVDIEAMTPGEYKNGGQDLTINYSIHDSSFGYFVVASTDKGICNVIFVDEPKNTESELRSYWPNALLIDNLVDSHQPVIDFMQHKDPCHKIKLHLHGTNYQLKVWHALLTIREGRITTYGTISKSIGDITSLGARAAGTAIGSNPVSYIIPCHRVLQSTGAISGYRWGVTRKRAILAYESGFVGEWV